MKRIEALMAVAMMMSGVQVRAQVTVTPGDGGKTVIETVTNLRYGTVTLTWPADANIAGNLRLGSPYWVPGINPDGSMDQKTLIDFLAALNNPAHPFLGLTGWNVPTTVAGGANPDCTIQVKTGGPDIGYNCDGKASDLGELYYNQFGITAGHTVNETWSWQRWYFYNLVPDYYWQCNPAPGQAPSQCAHTFPSGQIPSFSFLSGYEGVQSDPNALFVMLVVPGDEIPREVRWWW